MNGCKRNVESIFYSFLGKRCGFHQRYHKRFNLWGHCQMRNPMQQFQAASRSAVIAFHGFHNNQARGVEFTIVAQFPPLLRNLLVACDNQITAHPCGKIADYRGFDIYSLLHCGILAQMPKLCARHRWPASVSWGVYANPSEFVTSVLRFVPHPSLPHLYYPSFWSEAGMSLWL